MKMDNNARNNIMPQSNISVISKGVAISLKKYQKSNLRKYCREYCDTASIHGLRYLTEKRSLCERFLWGLLIITSVAACGYLISRIYKKYDQSPVIVSFATKESPIYTIPFPAVTICPMSKVDRMEFNFTKVYHQLQDNETLSPEDELNGAYMSLVCEEATDLFPDNKTFTDDFFEHIHKIRIPVVYTLFSCGFMGKDFDCSSLFTPIILDEGICYTFNMMDREEIFEDDVVHFSNYHKNDETSKWIIDQGYSADSKADSYPRRALLSGADNALEIIFMHWTHNTDYICIEDVQGYSILLHTPHTIPLLKKQYFNVPHDNAVIAVVQPKMMTTSNEVKKYDPIDRECYFTNERPLRFFKIYTPDNCRLECLTNYTLKQCGCVNFYMPRDNSTSICGNGNYKCMKDAETQLKTLELNMNIDMEDYEDVETFCDCMPLCTELTYDIEQSLSEWNWNEQFRAERVEGHEERKEHIQIAKLTVFFKLEQFLTSQRNELYGPTDFLANFGGLLGLFTGFSLLSLMEIIYFLTIRIFCNIRRYKIWTGPSE